MKTLDPSDFPLLSARDFAEVAIALRMVAAGFVCFPAGGVKSEYLDALAVSVEKLGKAGPVHIVEDVELGAGFVMGATEPKRAPILVCERRDDRFGGFALVFRDAGALDTFKSMVAKLSFDASEH